MEDFNRTYHHCLMPLEGMTNWPQSDRSALKAPGYVKMPGRPKKERRREPTEQSKGVKLSKVGTVIRCSKCRGKGHNKSTCSSGAASASTRGNDIVPFSTGQTNEAGTKKRKRSAKSGLSTDNPSMVKCNNYLYSCVPVY